MLSARNTCKGLTRRSIQISPNNSNTHGCYAETHRRTYCTNMHICMQTHTFTNSKMGKNGQNQLPQRFPTWRLRTRKGLKFRSEGLKDHLKNISGACHYNYLWTAVIWKLQLETMWSGHPGFDFIKKHRLRGSPDLGLEILFNPSISNNFLAFDWFK